MGLIKTLPPHKIIEETMLNNMQKTDPLQERIDELEEVVNNYEIEIKELKQELELIKNDAEKYYDMLTDIYYTLRKEI